MAPLVSLDEYLSTPYDPDVEYVNGILVERTGGTPIHGLLQTLVGAYFNQVRHTYRINSFLNVRLKMKADFDCYRIPDITVLERPYTKGKFISDVPAVTVEILSPDDTFGEFMDKCQEYADLGIQNIVVLDPDCRRKYVFANRALTFAPSITLRLPKSAVDVPFPVDEMFAELDEGDD